MKTFKPTTPSRRNTVLTPYKELLSGTEKAKGTCKGNEANRRT